MVDAKLSLAAPPPGLSLDGWPGSPTGPEPAERLDNHIKENEADEMGAVPAPGNPAQREAQEHELAQYPMGVDGDDDEFSKTESPIVVIRDYPAGWVAALAVPSEGTHEAAAKAAFAQCIEDGDHGKLAMESDGEPSRVAPKIDAMDHLHAELPNLEAVMHESGVG